MIKWPGHGPVSWWRISKIPAPTEWNVQTSLVGTGWCSSTPNDNCQGSLATVIRKPSDRLEPTGRVAPKISGPDHLGTSFYGATRSLECTQLLQQIWMTSKKELSVKWISSKVDIPERYTLKTPGSDLTRKRVPWGQTHSWVRPTRNPGKNDRNLSPKCLSDSDSGSVWLDSGSVWPGFRVGLTPKWVWPPRTLFRVKSDPGVFRVYTCGFASNFLTLLFVQDSATTVPTGHSPKRKKRNWTLVIKSCYARWLVTAFADIQITTTVSQIFDIGILPPISTVSAKYHQYQILFQNSRKSMLLTSFVRKMISSWNAWC